MNGVLAPRRRSLHNMVRRFLGLGALVAADVDVATLDEDTALIVATFRHVLDVISAAGARHTDVMGCDDGRDTPGLFIEAVGPLDVRRGGTASVSSRVTVETFTSQHASVTSARCLRRARVSFMRDLHENDPRPFTSDWSAWGLFIDGHLAWASSGELTTPWTLHHAPTPCPGHLHAFLSERPIVIVELSQKLQSAAPFFG